jgi:hypothetical protein
MEEGMAAAAAAVKVLLLCNITLRVEATSFCDTKAAAPARVLIGCCCSGRIRPKTVIFLSLDGSSCFAVVLADDEQAPLRAAEASMETTFCVVVVVDDFLGPKIKLGGPPVAIAAAAKVVPTLWASSCWRVSVTAAADVDAAVDDAAADDESDTRRAEETDEIVDSAAQLWLDDHPRPPKDPKAAPKERPPPRRCCFDDDNVDDDRRLCAAADAVLRILGVATEFWTDTECCAELADEMPPPPTARLDDDDEDDVNLSNRIDFLHSCCCCSDGDRSTPPPSTRRLLRMAVGGVHDRRWWWSRRILQPPAPATLLTISVLSQVPSFTSMMMI